MIILFICYALNAANDVLLTTSLAVLTFLQLVGQIQVHVILTLYFIFSVYLMMVTKDITENLIYMKLFQVMLFWEVRHHSIVCYCLYHTFLLLYINISQNRLSVLLFCMQLIAQFMTYVVWRNLFVKTNNFKLNSLDVFNSYLFV